MKQVDTMQLTSSVFEDGEPIPDEYGYTRQNMNPPLEIGGVPEDAESLVLIMDDPDAVEPAGKVWDHWVVYDIDPTIRIIPEDSTPTGGVSGRNDYGELGYGGPNPPDRRHTYVIKLYAIDTALNLPEGASKEEVEAAMSGHILARGELTGTYAPEQSE